MNDIGKYLIIIGIILIVLGLVLYFTGNRLSWFGHLPGDIRIEKENVKFYFPITSLIILSLFMSLFLYLLRKLF